MTRCKATDNSKVIETKKKETADLGLMSKDAPVDEQPVQQKEYLHWDKAALITQRDILLRHRHCFNDENLRRIDNDFDS